MWDEDDALRSKRFQGWQPFAVVAEFAVGVVLDHREIVPLRDLEHRPAPRQGPGAAGRVVEGGSHVEDPGGPALPRETGRGLVERLRDHPLGVARHPGRNAAELAADLERDHVGRILEKHRIAEVRERVEGMADPLEAAAADEDLLGTAVDVLDAGHPRREELAKRGDPGVRRIVERLRRVVREDLRHRLPGLLDLEDPAVGHAAGERDDPRLLGEPSGSR